jgi:hypothetical protein
MIEILSKLSPLLRLLVIYINVLALCKTISKSHTKLMCDVIARLDKISVSFDVLKTLKMPNFFFFFFNNFPKKN